MFIIFFRAKKENRKKKKRKDHERESQDDLVLSYTVEESLCIILFSWTKLLVSDDMSFSSNVFVQFTRQNNCCFHYSCEYKKIIWIYLFLFFLYSKFMHHTIPFSTKNRKKEFKNIYHAFRVNVKLLFSYFSHFRCSNSYF